MKNAIIILLFGAATVAGVNYAKDNAVVNTFPTYIKLGNDTAYNLTERKRIKPRTYLAGFGTQVFPDTARVDYYLILKPSGSSATVSYSQSNDTIELINAIAGDYKIVGHAQVHGWGLIGSDYGQIDEEARDTINVHVRPSYPAPGLTLTRLSSTTLRVTYNYQNDPGSKVIYYSSRSAQADGVNGNVSMLGVSVFEPTTATGYRDFTQTYLQPFSSTVKEGYWFMLGTIDQFGYLRVGEWQRIL
jgi:hypothetical protein